MSSSPLSRRTVLRGLGTVMSLPMLEAMAPLTALAQTPKAVPPRVVFMFVPNGMSMAHWRPSASGALGELPSVLKPFADVKSHISIVTGLSQKHAEANGDGPGDHARSSAAWLTGCQPRKTSGTDIHVGLSIDQLLAREIGKESRFASLELGCERGAQAGDCDSGYSCAYSSTISWSSANTPVPREVNPRMVFERLFGSGESVEAAKRRHETKSSVLDYLLEDLKALDTKLGRRDEDKMDQYLSSVRQLETRLQKFESGLAARTAPPKGQAADFGEAIRLMGDMMILALQTNQTRVASLMFANEGSNRPYPVIGINDGHHEISHHGKDPEKLEKKRQIDLFHATQAAYILRRMAETPDLTGSLLDNSILVYGAGISDGDAHNHNDLPILLAGHGGGLKQGLHRVYQDRTPMTNLFCSIMGRLGVDAENFGDSTGRLRELF